MAYLTHLKTRKHQSSFILFDFKLICLNFLFFFQLAPSVRFPDLVELFSVFKEDEPHIKMHYDHQGNIFGTAEILFKFEKTANEAIKQYDKVPLDGYPMSLGFSKPGGRKHSPETAYFWKNKFAGKETPSQQQLGKN